MKRSLAWTKLNCNTLYNKVSVCISLYDSQLTYIILYKRILNQIEKFPAYQTFLDRIGKFLTLTPTVLYGYQILTEIDEPSNSINLSYCIFVFNINENRPSGYQVLQGVFSY
jgi:hypothetical protein